jgi:hypothetical protein
MSMCRGENPPGQIHDGTVAVPMVRLARKKRAAVRDINT